MLKNNLKKTSKISLRKIQVIALGIIGTALLFALAMPYIRPENNSINQIDSSDYNQIVTLEGVIIKDAPNSLPGSYYLMTLAGQAVRLVNQEIKVSEGTYVAVSGYITGYDSQGFQQMVLNTIEIKQ